MTSDSHAPSQAEGGNPNRALLVGLLRAFGAGILFSLPLMMTMEMWWLGFYMDRLRLALFMLLMIPLLVGLDRYSGFKETTTWLDDAVDGMIAYGVGTVSAAIILFVLGVIDGGMPLSEIVGKIALQAVPASFGAVLAASQLSGGVDEERKRHGGYAVGLLFMVGGAVFLAFNVAPTEEMVVLALRMTPWHGLALAALSLLLMHGFVFAVEFRGAPARPHGTSGWSLALRFTVVGYAISLLVSAYVLWTFGRFDGDPMTNRMMETIVLAFPASLGAAAARLML